MPLPGLPLHTSYGFIRRKNRPLSPAMEAFMQALRVEEKASARREADLARRFDGTFAHQGPPEREHDSYGDWDATGGYLLAPR